MRRPRRASPRPSRAGPRRSCFAVPSSARCCSPPPSRRSTRSRTAACGGSSVRTASLVRPEQAEGARFPSKLAHPCRPGRGHLDPEKTSAYGQGTTTKSQFGGAGTRRLALLGGFEWGVGQAPRRLAFRARRLIHHHARPWDDDLETLSDSGELLPDWYDDWLEIERERFRQLRLSALERLCIELTADGRFPEAVQAGVAAVAADRLRESAHRVLIAAHLAAGNPGEALQQYRSCRDVLARRLGWEPSLEMRLLVAALPFQASRITR